MKLDSKQAPVTPSPVAETTLKSKWQTGLKQRRNTNQRQLGLVPALQFLLTSFRGRGVSERELGLIFLESY